MTDLRSWGRRVALLGLLLACAALFGACSRAEVHRQEAYVFGTRVDVSVYGSDPAEARRAMDAVLREFDRLHAAYHAWKPSELTRLNDDARKLEAVIAHNIRQLTGEA